MVELKGYRDHVTNLSPKARLAHNIPDSPGSSSFCLPVRHVLGFF